MKKIILAAGLLSLTLYACKRSDNATPNGDFATTKQQALTDFVDVVAIPQYADLAQKAVALHSRIIALNTNSNQSSLDAAKSAWLDMRKVWEQCEGFIFGPVDEDNYDPNMDTWPTDFVEMDSLMNTTYPLTTANLENIALSLRGFHPIEYILFGDHGNRTPANLTTRQKEYMVSLAADLEANCKALSDSWATTGGKYGDLVKTAGNGSSKYASRREMFLTLADGLITICEEVGKGKMEDPFISQDPKTVESPYSGNSVADFRDNIVGLENVYLCRYNSKTGKSLSNVVAANNQALDNKIRGQITAAIHSFDNITKPYEEAIFLQGNQIRQTQAALAALEKSLNEDLKSYIQQYIKD